MKTINFAILCVLVLLPFHIVNDMRLDALKYTLETEMQYDAAITAAVQDATVALRLFVEQSDASSYASTKRIKADREGAVQAFFHTLYKNLEVAGDKIAEDALTRFIPVIAVIDYDGYSIMSHETYTNASGQKESKLVWSNVKPYAYADDLGNSISFTLDDYVIAYNASQNRWHEGFRSEIQHAANIPILNNQSLFEQVRRITIVNAIQNDLQYAINKHNETATRYGITYTFTLPTISQEEWNNTVDDIGIIAFIQGIPIGNERYNNYALGGGRISKTDPIYGSTVGGIKKYYRSSCGYSYAIQEVFKTEKDAAMAGYFPLRCK